MFRPRDSHDQRLISADLTVDPGRARCAGSTMSSATAWRSSTSPARRASCASRRGSCSTTRRRTRSDFEIDAEALTYPFAYDPEEVPDLAADHAPALPRPPRSTAGRGASCAPDGRTETGRLLMTLCFAIHESFAYSRRSRARHPAAARSPCTLRRGTCRDFALLMMEAVRALGLAARFVTGYVYVPSRDGSTTRGGGATHAWCQVYLPGAGWVEFDPTNGIVGNRDLIRVAVARDPAPGGAAQRQLPRPARPTSPA